MTQAELETAIAAGTIDPSSALQKIGKDNADFLKLQYLIDLASLLGSTISVSAQVGELTDRSDTIDTGGTAQQVAEANTSRRYLLFQNHSDTDMWINFGTDAVASQPSIKIAAGVAYTPTFVDTRAISVICATMGKAFTCKEG